jgi:2-methylisocitrate lyase-like PEP mutase family enzyme
MNPGRSPLQALLERGTPLVVPGVYDGLTAALACAAVNPS